MKISKLSKILFAPIAALALLLSPSIPAHAEGASITVTPSDRKITLQAGENYRSTIRISNSSEATEDLKFKLYATPYFYTDDNYNEVDYDTQGVYNKIVDWIEFDQDSGTVAPNEVLEVGFTVKVPQNATAGGQYAAAVVEKVTDNTSASGDTLNVKSVHRVAMPIYAQVAGPTTEKGAIKENNIGAFFLKTPITTTSLIENSGNVHADATYIMRIYPLFSDEEIYSNEESDNNKKIILPGTNRFYTQEADTDKVGPVGIYRVEQEIKFLDQTSTTSKVVILCPTWLLLLVVFVIVFIVVWLVMRNKNRKAAGKGKSSSKSSSTHTATHSDHKSEKSEKSENADKPKSPDAK